MTAIKSWFKENQALAVFLIAQSIAFAVAAATFVAYSVRLENRVLVIETRGSSPVSDRLSKHDDRLTTIESHLISNRAQLDRIVNELLRDRQQQR